MTKNTEKKQDQKSNITNILNKDEVQFKPSHERKNTWYHAGSEYNYDIKQKLLAEGCRQPYRFVIECRNSNKGLSMGCQKADQDYSECMKFYKYLVKKKNQ